MEIENHKEEVPFAYYEGLFKNIDPVEVTGRLADVTWDGKDFFVSLLGVSYAVGFPGAEIREVDPHSSHGEAVTASPQGEALGERSLRRAQNDKGVPMNVQTFLLRYLLESKSVAWAGQWKTFREMPWGEMYIKPYTGRVLTRAAFTFGTRVDAFRAACEKMGALPLKHGDAGYQFDFIGGYAMQIMVWEGDEEFPPNAQVLYSDNFQEGFAAEDRVVAGDILITAIKQNM